MDTLPVIILKRGKDDEPAPLSPLGILGGNSPYG